jgi:hydroxyacylglutathione hydrolase
VNNNENVIVRQLTVGPMANHVYLLGSRSAEEAAIIDPGWEAETIVAAAEAENLKITKILLTHAHYDHIDALGDLLELTDAEVYVHEIDLEEVRQTAPDAIGVVDDGEIQLGDLTIQCLHTPGHTVGSQCFLVEGFLFTGDTLFVGACGRCDFPNSDPHAFFYSLQRLANLDNGVQVMSGHAYGPKPVSTIGEEKATNPYLQVPDIDTWAQQFGL